MSSSKPSLLLMLAVLFSQAVRADNMQAFNEAKALANRKLQSSFNGVNSGSAQQSIPKFGSSADEAGYFAGGQGQLSGYGVGKMQTCANQAPGADRLANQECEAVNLLAHNPQVRPAFPMDKNSPVFQKSRQINQNAEQAFAQYFPNRQGESSACVSKTETTPGQYSTQICADIKEAEGQQCTMGRLIDIDSDANFQCEQTINSYEHFKCKRSSNVTCTGGGDGCDQGGIIPNSWAGDMATSFIPVGAGNFMLQFGTIADNYWRGWGAVYDRSLSFEVRDTALISRFSLTRAAFDDWLLVKVNGSTVYVGPYGGDRLEVVSRCAWTDSETGQCAYYQNVVQYCANCFGSPELSTSWNIGLNIDIRRFLRNGSNTIFMRTIVAGGGEGAIQLTTRQFCPLQCSVSTRNDCASLEARSR